MEIVQLFIAAWMPVLKMLIATGVGSFIATDFVGIFGAEARKNINNIIFYVFYPCLATSNLSQAFTLQSIAKTWFMPINIFLIFLIGSMFGLILAKITKAPPHLKPLLLGCCATGNLGIMLLIVIPGTCNEKSSPFGDAAKCHEQAMAYASLSLGISDVIFWSYIYNMVRLLLGMTKSKINAIIHEESMPELSLEEGPKSFDEKDSNSIIEEQNCKTFQKVESNPKEDEFPSVQEATKSFFQMPTVVALTRLLTPSTYGVMVGLLIGAVSTLKNALVGESAPLRAIQGAVKMLGDAAVPATTLIMGGNLLKGFRKSDTKVSYIVGIVLVRYLFLPLVGVGIIKGAVHYGILHQDPLYLFVLLVQYALPPAMNLGVIMQLFNSGESECSIIMFWTYALTLVLFPLWSGFFMWLVA